MTTDPPKTRRRFFRFSLRTLMLVAAVSCIWLGVITNRARDRKQAMELFHSLGGSVWYEHEFWGNDPPGPEWLRRLIGDEYFFSVHTLRLTNSKVDDSSLASIKRFPELKGLTLFQCKVTDAGLEHLKDLTELRRLYLDETRVTEAGLVHLEGMTRLRSLRHANTEITDAGVKKLRSQQRQQSRRPR
jgi:hypothetical protein